MIKSKTYTEFDIHLEWNDELVFGPSPLAEFLASNIKASDKKLVLDIGCGTGFLGLIAAKQGAEKVIAIDNNANAINCIKRNINNNNLQNRFLIFDVDFNIFNYEFEFDYIICNPPSLPVPPNIFYSSQYVYNKGYEGGIDGRDLLDKILNFTINHLSKTGELLILHTEFANTEKTINYMNSNNFMCDIIDEQYFPLMLKDEYDRNSYLEGLLHDFGKAVIRKNGLLMEKISILLFQRRDFH